MSNNSDSVDQSAMKKFLVIGAAKIETMISEEKIGLCERLTNKNFLLKIYKDVKERSGGHFKIHKRGAENSYDWKCSPWCGRRRGCPCFESTPEDHLRTSPRTRRSSSNTTSIRATGSMSTSADQQSIPGDNSSATSSSCSRRSRSSSCRNASEKSNTRRSASVGAVTESAKIKGASSAAASDLNNNSPSTSGSVSRQGSSVSGERKRPHATDSSAEPPAIRMQEDKTDPFGSIQKISEFLFVYEKDGF